MMGGVAVVFPQVAPFASGRQLADLDGDMSAAKAAQRPPGKPQQGESQCFFIAFPPQDRLYLKHR
jgi:hypothetical protein